ncbi:MAG: anthranilate synthase component I family protein [Gemmatimonadetes bacterium]|nr:anthranilate synthase component I family protein [Gemmatimonadota bacterium]
MFPFVKELQGLFRLRPAGNEARRGASIRFDSLGSVSDEARYSYESIDPYREIVVHGRQIETHVHHESGTVTRVTEENPWDRFDAVAREFRALSAPAIRADSHTTLPPLPSVAGYWGYGLTPFAIPVERVQPDPLGLPDAHLAFFDTIVVRIREENRTLLVSTGRPETDPARRARRAELRLRELESQVVQDTGEAGSRTSPSQSFEWTPEPRAPYQRAIRAILSHIREGDIYQANHTELFRMPTDEDARTHYAALRNTNPAHYSALFDTGDAAVISSSPELFLRVTGRDVVSAPIKGTRPRGADPESDERLQRDLRASEKDLAEHTMIVDLVRNDLGKSCDAGSVHVEPFLNVESHPTVHHLVSYVRGRLPESATWATALRDLFPGGSVTGTPKRRAVQIIDEQETTGRGAFYGCLGFADEDGRGVWNLLIRSAVWKPGELAFRVGGGIVADSTAEGEWEELAWKGSALHRAFAARSAVKG